MALPKPSGDFEWVQESWGAALRCAPLAAIAPHCFSTRELALEGARDDDRRRLGSSRARARSRVSTASCRCARCMARVSSTQRAGHTVARAAYDDWPEADIAITRDPSIALTVRTADCVPILLADRRTGAVAAVHAGWKGTAAGRRDGGRSGARMEVRQRAGRHRSPPSVRASGRAATKSASELAPQLRTHIRTPAMVLGDTKAAAGSLACHARSARARRRARRSRSTSAELCTVGPSRALSLLPSRWDTAGTSRGGD